MAVVRRVKKNVAVVEEPEKEATPAEEKELVDLVVDMVNAGVVDSGFDRIFTAVEDRLVIRTNQINADRLKATKVASKVAVVEISKLPTTPPRRKATLTPVVAKNYLMVAEFPKLGGATVQFVRLRKDDENKAVVEMVTGKPGYPEGKNITIPVAALREAPVKTRKRATAVVPATTRKVAPTPAPTKRRPTRKAAR